MAPQAIDGEAATESARERKSRLTSMRIRVKVEGSLRDDERC